MHLHTVKPEEKIPPHSQFNHFTTGSPQMFCTPLFLPPKESCAFAFHDAESCTCDKHMHLIRLNSDHSSRTVIRTPPKTSKYNLNRPPKTPTTGEFACESAARNLHCTGARRRCWCRGGEGTLPSWPSWASEAAPKSGPDLGGCRSCRRELTNSAETV